MSVLNIYHCKIVTGFCCLIFKICILCFYNCIIKSMLTVFGNFFASFRIVSSNVPVLEFDLAFDSEHLIIKYSLVTCIQKKKQQKNKIKQNQIHVKNNLARLMLHLFGCFVLDIIILNFNG